MKYIKKFEEKEPEFNLGDDLPMGFEGGKALILDKIEELMVLYGKFSDNFPNTNQHMIDSHIARLNDMIMSIETLKQSKDLNRQDFNEDTIEVPIEDDEIDEDENSEGDVWYG